MTKINICAFDGAKSNFGIALMTYDVDTGELEVTDMELVKTEKSKAKNVRVSSDNLRRAQELAAAVRRRAEGCVICFAEIPSGAQSADASLAFGIVIGLYASVTIPLVEVSPFETKRAALGTNTASKQEMIEWACAKFPNAPWRKAKRNGVMTPTLDNEHLADAVAIAHAGVRTPAFQQTVAILKASRAAA